jgi:hypothetical protein
VVISENKENYVSLCAVTDRKLTSFLLYGPGLKST